MADNIRRGT